MPKRSITAAVVACLLNLAFSSGALAQTPDDQQLRKTKIFVNNVGVGNRQAVKVKLTTRSGTLKGHITKINDDDFVVSDKKGVDTTIAYRDVRNISRDHVPYWVIPIVVVGALFALVGICAAAGKCQD